MLNAIILEDEEDSRNLLSGFLKDYFPLYFTKKIFFDYYIIFYLFLISIVVTA